MCCSDGVSGMIRLGKPVLGLVALLACSGDSSNGPVPVATVAVSLTANLIAIGQTTQAAAALQSASGAPLTGRQIAWQSSNPSVATVAGTGALVTVTAVAAGSTNISATSEGKSGSAALTVVVPPDAITAFTITPTTVTLATPGATQVITTTPTIAAGATVQYTSVSSNPAVATVTGTGASPTITAVTGGTATVTISAAASGTGLTSRTIDRTVSVTVTSVATLQLSFDGTVLGIGESAQATATTRDLSGTVITRPITWSSSTPAVASVGGSGATVTITALTAGQTTISATSEGVTTNQIVRVRAPGACTQLSADANTIALFHFNEDAGQVVTNSAAGGVNGSLGPDATTAQDPSWIDTGIMSAALRFTRGPNDASSDYVWVNTGVALPTNQITIELYVRPRVPYGHGYLFNSDVVSVFVAIDFQGRIEFGVGDNDWTILTANAPVINDGNWHQVAVTYNGATQRIYIDGQERTSGPATRVMPNLVNMYIGGRPFNTFLNGDIDEVRVSRVARTAQEIQASYCQ